MTIYFTFYKKPKYDGDSCFFKMENIYPQLEDFKYDDIVNLQYAEVFECSVKNDIMLLMFYDNKYENFFNLLMSAIHYVQTKTNNIRTVEVFINYFYDNFDKLVSQITKQIEK